MARQKTVLGIPVGKKSHNGVGRALAGVGLAALPAVAVPVARRVGQAVSSGSEKIHQVSEVAETASNVKDAVSSRRTKIGKASAVISEISKLGGGDGDAKPKLSHLIEEHTDVAVPRSVLYNQWTQFKMFPSITKGVDRVEQKDRSNVAWTVKIGPSRRTLDAKITEQRPDERIAFESEGGLDLQGVVTFHSRDKDLTRVLVQMQYKPKGFVEGVGNLVRIPRRRVRRDLRLYKHFMELRNEETGSWRGRIAKQDDSKNQDSDSQRKAS